MKFQERRGSREAAFGSCNETPVPEGDGLCDWSFKCADATPDLDEILSGVDQELEPLPTQLVKENGQNMGLLFCLANTRMRHEVNQASSAKVHSSGRAFEQFKEAINDEDFEDRRRTCSRRCCRFSTFRVGSSFESVSKLLLTGKRAFTFVVFRLIVGRR